MTTEAETTAWLINQIIYTVNDLRSGMLAGYTAFLNSSLLVQNITANDVRNGTEYSCAIVPRSGDLDILRQSDPTILFVTGKYE